MGHELFSHDPRRLIREAIKEAPPEQQKRMLAKQYELDLRREKMPQQQFIASLFHDIGENMENMLDQFNSIVNLAVPR